MTTELHKGTICLPRYYLNAFICIEVDEKQECFQTSWDRQFPRTQRDESSWESHRNCEDELYSLSTINLNNGVFH